MVFSSMGMLEYILSCQKIIILKEMVRPVVYNLTKYLITLSALDEKFCHEVVCNLHHINEPMVAYIHLK